MEDEVKKIIGHNLDNIGLWVDSVKYEREGNTNYLRICLDSKDIIDVEKIVSATHIINPLIDSEDLIDDEYILDIFGKSKGD